MKKFLYDRGFGPVEVSMETDYLTADNNNNYKVTLDFSSSQKVLVNGEEQTKVEFTVVGDWEFKDVVAGMQSMRRKLQDYQKGLEKEET